jgi:hypothetical protein
MRIVGEYGKARLNPKEEKRGREGRQRDGEHG